MYTEGIFSTRKRETTEWEDVQIKFGNFAPHPKEPEDPEITYSLDEKDEGETIAERLLKAKGADEVDDLLEDEFDDERFFEEYRQRRMKEMQEKLAKSRYGEVTHIKEYEYKAEVANEKIDAWVVCHVFKPSMPKCQLLNKLLDQLATKFKDTKFVKIYSQEAIPGYPDRNLPTILIYHKGELKKQFVTIESLGGTHISTDDLEWLFKNVGCVNSNMLKNPRSEEEELQSKRNRSGIDLGYITRLDDDEW